MNRVRLMLGLSVAAVLVLLSACGPAPTPEVIKEMVEVEVTRVVEKEGETVVETVIEQVEVEVTAAPEKATISFAHHGSAEESDMYQDTVDGFMEEFPNITVERIHIPEDYKRKVETMIAGGTPPDVFWIHASYFAKFDQAGTLLDLTPFIEADLFPIDAYYESAVNQFSSDGRVYGIPRETSSIVLFYNKNMFDAAGLEYPQEDWTYDDVLEAAQALTNADELKYGILAPREWHLLQPVIWSFGGEVLNQPENTKCLMDSPETIAAIQWVADLMNVHNVAPTVADLSGQDATGMFLNDQLAMMWTGRWGAAGILNADPNFNFDIQHMPTGAGGKVTRLSSGAYGIPADSQHPEAAWQLVKYLASRPVYDFLAAGGLIIPAYIPSAVGPAMMDPTKPPEHNVFFLDALNYAKSEPYNVVYPEMLDIIQPQIDSVMLGEMTAEEAVKPICPEVDELLASQ